jgi:hypothetical protein
VIQSGDELDGFKPTVEGPRFATEARSVRRKIVAESSLLELTAEVSIAITGFISIFLVLAARDGRLLPVDAFTIRIIVICSFGPVFYAALPLLLNSLGLSGATLWRISSTVIGCGGIAVAVYMARQLRFLEPGEGRKLNHGFVLGVAAFLSCLAHALGWPWEPSGGLSLVTVWSIVGISAGNFVDLLFSKLLQDRAAQ